MSAPLRHRWLAVAGATAAIALVAAGCTSNTPRRTTAPPQPPPRRPPRQRQRRARRQGHHRLLRPRRRPRLAGRDQLSRQVAEAAKYSDVDFKMAEGTNDVSLQISQIEQFINDGVDAIVLLPIDGAALTEVATKAMNAGIPVVNVDREFSDPNAARTTVLGDNYGMGVSAGKYICEQLGGKADAKVAEIAGIDSLPLTQDRSKGFKDALAKCGLKVDARVAADFTVQGGEAAAANLLQAAAEARRHLEPRRRPGRRRPGGHRRRGSRRVLHGRRRRLEERHGRHQGRQHGAQGDGHLPVDAGCRRRQARPPARAGARRMSDLVDVRGAAQGPAVRARRDQGQRRPVPAHRRSSPDHPTDVTAGRAVRGPPGTTDRKDERHERTSRRRHGRLRVHGRRPLAGLAQRTALLRPAAAARTWRRSPVATRPRSPPRPRGSAGRASRPTGRRSSSATTSTWSTSARPATRTPRSPSRRSRRASTCCARSRWPTRVAEAEAMADGGRGGARQRRQLAMVGFTYRRVPAIQLARQLVADGRIGTVRHVRAQYLQDWIADANAPLSWRLDKQKAGSGALGDIGAHIVDLAQFVTGEQVTGVSAILETFVHERPLAAESAVGLHGTAGHGDRPGHRRRRRDLPRPDVRRGRGDVRGDPVRAGAARTRSASRSTGRRGSLAFDFEDMNVLHFFDVAAARRRGRLPPDRRDRARAPVRGSVVAGRARARATSTPSRTRPSTWSTAIAERRRAGADLRRRAAGPAGAGRRRAVRGRHDSTVDTGDEEQLTMARPITLFTGQWADLPFEEVARLASGWGYDGLEIACWGDHLDPWRCGRRRATSPASSRSWRSTT